MIYIEKDKVNSIVLTLSESSTLSNPFYLFSFKNEFKLDSEPIFFTTTDESDYTNRYNLFSIEESLSGSTSGGTSVALSLVSGQYEYKVYESTGSTLSIANTTGKVIESGRMVVYDDDSETITNIINSVYL